MSTIVLMTSTYSTHDYNLDEEFARFSTFGIPIHTFNTMASFKDHSCAFDDHSHADIHAHNIQGYNLSGP